MKKNVVFWIGVKNEKYSEKYGGWEWMDISRRTWEYWCKKHDVLFVPFEEPIEKDLTKFRINWQKAIFVFDELERRNIDYDQIYLVDGMNMIKWNAPNVFEMTDRKFTAWRDMDNLRWIYDSIQGYKPIFNDFKIDLTKYISSGLIIFNESHREIFQTFKKLYYDNVDTFVELQDKLVRKGTEQTPLNYWLQMNNVDIKTDLPLSWKLTHMHRKEMLIHNRQIEGENTPFFIKYGYIWNFSGMPKDNRTKIMTEAWDLVKENYNIDEIQFDNILNDMPHKDTAKYTTSRKFKLDLLKHFSDEKYKDLTMIELGSCQGNSTVVYSKLFKKVYGVEINSENIEKAKLKCKDINNVEFIQKDIYDGDWDFPQADVIMIDAGHTYDNLVQDIQKTISYFDNPTIIIDDYGNPNLGVRKAINEMVDKNVIKLSKLIGEESGFKTAAGWSMNDREGGIFNV